MAISQISDDNLLIKRVGEIITFKDLKTLRRHYITRQVMRRIYYGKGYCYATPYTPLPIGRPKKSLKLLSDNQNV